MTSGGGARRDLAPAGTGEEPGKPAPLPAPPPHGQPHPYGTPPRSADDHGPMVAAFVVATLVLLFLSLLTESPWFLIAWFIMGACFSAYYSRRS